MISDLVDRQALEHRGDSPIWRGFWNGIGWAHMILGPLWAVVAAVAGHLAFLVFAVTWTSFGLFVLTVQHRAHGTTRVRRTP